MNILKTVYVIYLERTPEETALWVTSMDRPKGSALCLFQLSPFCARNSNRIEIESETLEDASSILNHGRKKKEFGGRDDVIPTGFVQMLPHYSILHVMPGMMPIQFSLLVSCEKKII